MYKDSGFKNLPDEQSRVEIGYGVSEIHWNKGYMTEVVGAIIKWAIHDGKVSAVIAETDKNNFPSQLVLEKNGMRIFNETEEFLWWTT